MFIQLEIKTRNKVDLVDITEKVQRAVNDYNVEEGICFLFCPHTTAGLILNENWDPTVEQDVIDVLSRMVPENLPYRHAEGNAPSHIKSILVGNDHFVFIRSKQLALGTWQGIFLAEFDGPRHRKIWLKIINEEASA